MWEKRGLNISNGYFCCCLLAITGVSHSSCTCMWRMGWLLSIRILSSIRVKAITTIRWLKFSFSISSRRFKWKRGRWMLFRSPFLPFLYYICSGCLLCSRCRWLLPGGLSSYALLLVWVNFISPQLLAIGMCQEGLLWNQSNKKRTFYNLASNNKWTK